VSDGLEEGRSSPLGATPAPNGVNFSVFSRHATGVQLLLFDGVEDAKGSRAMRVDPGVNRSYYYWHVFVPGVRAGQLYAYRVEGPFDPANGLRFDPTKVLLDPYGRGVAVPQAYGRDAARSPGDKPRRP
jgi:isoamylase